MTDDSGAGGKTVLDMNLKERCFTWLFNQGTSTVLLVGIICGAFWVVPIHIKTIQEGYEKINKENRDERQRDRDNDAVLRTLINASHDRALEKNAEAVKDVAESLDRLTEKVRTP